MLEIKEYTIENADYRLKFLNIGAVITELSYKGKNVVLSFEELDSYRDNSTYMGSIVGRSAGRIRNGQIDGWQLPLNQDGKHNLHGNQLHYRFYDVSIVENIATLSLQDPEGDFPGNVGITVIYELTNQGLKQRFLAKSDKPTVLNMTNHSYFNIDSDIILDHKLQIEADTVLELDEDSLPVGEIEVSGTAFDFNKPHEIRDALNMGHDQFKYSKFIDHPYKLTGDIKLVGNSLTLEIETDQEYVVVYAGNHLGEEGKKLKNGMNKDYYAICLETQAAPDTTDLVTEYEALTYYKVYESGTD